MELNVNTFQCENFLALSGLKFRKVLMLVMVVTDIISSYLVLPTIHQNGHSCLVQSVKNFVQIMNAFEIQLTTIMPLKSAFPIAAKCGGIEFQSKQNLDFFPKIYTNYLPINK